MSKEEANEEPPCEVSWVTMVWGHENGRVPAAERDDHH